MDIKHLPGWMTLRDARIELGYKSRQSMHDAVHVQRVFDADDLAYVTTAKGEVTQPLYLVRVEAVEALKAQRQARLAV